MSGAWTRIDALRTLLGEASADPGARIALSAFQEDGRERAVERRGGGTPDELERWALDHLDRLAGGAAERVRVRWFRGDGGAAGGVVLRRAEGAPPRAGETEGAHPEAPPELRVLELALEQVRAELQEAYEQSERAIERADAADERAFDAEVELKRLRAEQGAGSAPEQRAPDGDAELRERLRSRDQEIRQCQEQIARAEQRWIAVGARLRQQEEQERELQRLKGQLAAAGSRVAELEAQLQEAQAQLAASAGAREEITQLKRQLHAHKLAAARPTSVPPVARGRSTEDADPSALREQLRREQTRATAAERAQAKADAEAARLHELLEKLAVRHNALRDDHDVLLAALGEEGEE